MFGVGIRQSFCRFWILGGFGLLGGFLCFSCLCFKFVSWLGWICDLMILCIVVWVVLVFPDCGIWC